MNPLDKVDALTDNVVCANSECGHTYRPIDGIKKINIIKCPKYESSLDFDSPYKAINARWRELAPLGTANSFYTCSECLHETEPIYASFRQNIGLFFVRFSSERDDVFCKKCMTTVFFKRTFITGAIGWFGIISFFSPLFTLLKALLVMAEILISPAKEVQISQVGLELNSRK